MTTLHIRAAIGLELPQIQFLIVETTIELAAPEAYSRDTSLKTSAQLAVRRVVLEALNKADWGFQLAVSDDNKQDFPNIERKEEIKDENTNNTD